MPSATSVPPVVLCCSGHDPTGGAGIQADIETLIGFGCHPCTVVTALTVQDTRNVTRILPQPAGDFLEQALALVDDIKPAVVKIGLLGSAELARAMGALADRLGSGVPVVLDPILAAGGGRDLAAGDLMTELKSGLIPRALVITPNTPEARRLTGLDDPDAAARALLALGCPNILLTGTHEDAPEVANRWYHSDGVETRRWPRLPGNYHGSGCTLAAAVAAGLARGLPLAAAIDEAQRFTFEALSRGFGAGKGQLLPNRARREAG